MPSTHRCMQRRQSPDKQPLELALILSILFFTFVMWYISRDNPLPKDILHQHHSWKDALHSETKHYFLIYLHLIYNKAHPINIGEICCSDEVQG